MAIRVWLWIISGRCQGVGRVSGPQRLANEINRRFAGKGVDCGLLRWREGWRERAEEIRWRSNGEVPRIGIAGYSWGGDAAVKLCRALDERGLAVERLVLCDAVYRSPLRSLRWLSLTPWPILAIPPNVRRVAWFFQRRNLALHGHRVVAENAKATRIEPGRELYVRHEHMDDQPIFADAVCQAFEEVCQVNPNPKVRTG